jgi:predicted Zn-dependent protease
MRAPLIRLGFLWVLMVSSAALLLAACRPALQILHAVGRPAEFTSLTLVPMGDAPPGGDSTLEIDAIRGDLEKRFPGLTVRVAPREPLPAGVVDEQRDQIIAERLQEKLAGRRGTIAILSQDLGSEYMNFVFGSQDRVNGVGVVSMIRFADVAPYPIAASAAPTIAPLPDTNVPEPVSSIHRTNVLHPRLLGQLVSTTAKMLGVSHVPCDREKCALHFPRNVEQVDAKGTELCEEHAAEVASILKQRLRH